MALDLLFSYQPGLLVNTSPTVTNIDVVYQQVLTLSSTFACSNAGAPKEHPWGEKSFLLIDPDGNRWEITESPTKDGILLNRE